MRLIKVAGAALNQTPFGWDNNQQNILNAISEAKGDGVQILGLPELCTTGYGCEDEFFRPDLRRRAWQMVQDILPYTKGMAVALSLPILHKNKIYNCIAFVVDCKVRGFVAKKALANDGIHYEARQFEAWPENLVEEIEIDGKTYPIGDLYFRIGDILLGFEICEGAWKGKRDGANLVGKGVDIIIDPSASHFAFGKMQTRQRLVLEGSRAFGCTYVYVNLLGNEAGRAIYDGGTMIAHAGEFVAVGKRFSYRNQVLTSAVVDVEHTRMMQSRTASYKPDISGKADERCIFVDFTFPTLKLEQQPKVEREAWEASTRLKEEEFSRVIPLGLFDYLRKSMSNGFMLSLSGGADSTAVAYQVKLMVHFGVAELGIEGFKAKLAHIKGLDKCTTNKQLINKLFVCAYQATKQSSRTTATAARKVAEDVGARYFCLNIEPMVRLFLKAAEKAIGRKLTWEEDDISLQNLQARVRAPMIWLLANIFNMLLLATSNRSEGAVGYCTMDGDTAGGLSPLAGIDKCFLKWWLLWLQMEGPLGMGPTPVLIYVTKQQPTAELRPLAQAQTDEKDLMPYDVLNEIEEEDIENNRSPIECYQVVRVKFRQYAPLEIAAWVEKFFRKWSINQWKRERFAPALHCDTRNLDPRTWRRSPILSGGYARELADLRNYANEDHLQNEREKEGAMSTASDDHKGTASAGHAATANGIVRAFVGVDAITTFGDEGELPVKGGNAIGPVIGRLVTDGGYDFTVEVYEAHPEDNWGFACNHADAREYLDVVLDGDGEPQRVYPVHAREELGQCQPIKGIDRSKFTAVFRKGTGKKHVYSGMTPEVVQWLRARKVTDLDFGGLVESICAGLSGLEAIGYGFKVRIVSDAVVDLAPELLAPEFKDVVLRLKDAGAQFVSSAEVIAAAAGKTGEAGKTA